MKSLSLWLFVAACALGAAAPLREGGGATNTVADAFPGWPTSFEGKPLRSLPLSPLELQFQANFPGRVGRFSDGQRELIVRWVAAGTRKLHPSSDCFKANGYTLVHQAVQQLGQERWSAFSAVRGGQRYLVRERIHDSAGGQWSDVSAWYWAVQLGRSQGPWWAVTVASSKAL